MQDRPMWVSMNGDAERPNVARLYDYYLGGAHNFAVDREFADQSTRLLPIDEITRSSRSFLRRAVRTCVAAGIRQFLDLGSGIPTAGNVHEVAQQLDPTCRVVYVDNDPVAVAHSRTMLRGSRTAAIVHADIRDPSAVLRAPEAKRLLDLDQPVAVLMIGILPCLSDRDDPGDLIAEYREAIAPGSYLVLSHLTADVEPELASRMVTVTQQAQVPIWLRAKGEVEEFLTGFQLVEPGLVLASRWRGEADEQESAATSLSYGAVGIKPGIS